MSCVSDCCSSVLCGVSNCSKLEIMELKGKEKQKKKKNQKREKVGSLCCVHQNKQSLNMQVVNEFFDSAVQSFVFTRKQTQILQDPCVCIILYIQTFNEHF